jgi:hypothetical protein
MKLDKYSVVARTEKIYLVSKFLDQNPNIEIQDLYKWLYYGEFGYEEQNAFLRAKKNIPKLQQLIDEIEDEREENIHSGSVWKPVGCSHKFVMVYVTPYFERECPLVRLVNLMERSSAFAGSRMQFKLDWGIIKEYALSMNENWSKDDFYQFEDRIGFHQLPIISFSEEFMEHHPYKFRIISQKLFFEYFPEFYEESLLSPPKRSDPSIG